VDGEESGQANIDRVVSGGAIDMSGCLEMNDKWTQSD
jgi:hypothetical protein